MCIQAKGLAFFTTTQDKQREKRHSSRSRPATHLAHVTGILCLCLAASIIPQCQGFFFPKSFFGKGNDGPPPPPAPQYPRVLAGGGSVQNNYGGEHLQGSGTDVQPALRIVNRPPPPRNNNNNNNDQQQQPSGPVPGAGFHVPKELCIACERFPWTPVAGGERPGAVGAASTSVSHSQQPQKQQYQQQQQQYQPQQQQQQQYQPPQQQQYQPPQQQQQYQPPQQQQQYQPPQQQQQYQQQHQFTSASAQGSTPTKTIVINALGEAQGPVPALPPLSSGRRPFAIQFDGSQSGNKVNYQNGPKQQAPPPPPPPSSPVGQQNNFSQDKPDKPVTFQIFQAQSPNQQATILQQQSHPIGLQPPPFAQPGAHSQYGRPTVLLPVNSQSTHVGASLSVQSGQASAPPPNPLAVGTIIASQQQNNNAALPQFQKIEQAKLVYQEHFTNQPSSAPPAPQNFKVPIISHPPQPQGSDVKAPSENLITNSIAQQPYIPQQNYGAPPPPPPQDNNFKPGGIFLQMRPPAPYQIQPRPSPNMKPPGPVIHYGRPIRIPNNIGPQRPSGQVIFPPPQAFLQLGPPPSSGNNPNSGYNGPPPPPPSNNPNSGYNGPPPPPPGNNPNSGYGGPPPPPPGNNPNSGYGAPPRPDSINTLDASVRPYDERRPSPSGQILNIQLPQQQNTNRPPLPQQGQPLNSIQPVPIPIPTTLHPSSNQQVGNGNDNNRPNNVESAFTQETGWEIIPSIQTDLTHLFSTEKGRPSPQGGKELPVPVPIPVPQSHPSKSPFFIVAGAGHQQQQQQKQQQQQHEQQQEQIKVQDVTYHEESRNPVPSVSPPLNTIHDDGQFQNNEQQQQQHNIINTNSLAGVSEIQQNVEQPEQHPPPTIPQQIITRPRPFILGVPAGPTRPVIFRPYPQQQPYQQLHPSIMTALNHAQQTSLLTHQYFRQPNLGQTLRENTIYVGPASNGQQVQQIQTSNNVLLGESASNSVQQENVEANNLDEEQQQQVNHGIDPRIPAATSTGSGDQNNPNCQQGTQQQQQQLQQQQLQQQQLQQQPWLIPITTHQKQQHQAEDNEHQQQQQQQNQEIGQVTGQSEDQSVSSSAGFNPGQDDQSQSLTGSGRDNVYDDDITSSSDSLAPDPTYATSLASVPPTAATTLTTAFNSVGSTASASSSPGIRGSISVSDNGNKGSYVIYYPRPVSKSPVYWVQQPSRTLSQGVVRLSPQITPVSPSVASTMVTWSRPRVVVANQFRTEHQPQQQLEQQQHEDPNSQEARSQESYERGEETNGSEEKQAQSGQVSTEHNSNDDENIPFGQKLGVTRDKIQTPYDIISIGGSDDDAQSLEETPVPSDHSQNIESVEQQQQRGKDHYGESDFTSSGQDGSTTGIGNDQIDINSGPSREYPEENQKQQLLQNENNLQSVQQQQQQETNESHHDENEDADDERDDFGFRPQTTFRKPISTTVIHSPGASSFQSLKLPNFKPHRVIVHDFTTHSANAAATGPSASASEQQESIESSKISSETLSNAWTASQKLKSPKLVESNDDEEESSESIHRPQGFNIQEVIASGPVSNADCLTTTHNGHLLTSLSSTSPRTAESLATLATSAKGRDIFLPLGSRFPAGRPSIFSAIHRPLSPQLIPVPTTTTKTGSSSPTTVSSLTNGNTQEQDQEAFNPSNNNKRERYLGQSPSGFAASIPVPVYRRPISIVNHVSQDSFNRDESNVGRGSSSNNNNIHSEGVTYIRPQANIILSAEDIYKTSEMKEERGVVDNASNNDPIKVVESSTSVSSSVDSETMDEIIMSTEKSSSFSVSSVVDEKSGGFSSSKDESSSSSSFGRKNNNKDSFTVQQVGTTKPLNKVNVVQVTSIPVTTDTEPITATASTTLVLTPSPSSFADSLTSTTAVPSPASTSTKIVKTVRVRQRMRSGSFNGPLRTRFHGGGRVRVVHRPANQEYIRHFPEFATQEGDKLAKEEEQEVKNALIELKKSTEPVKTQ